MRTLLKCNNSKKTCSGMAVKWSVAWEGKAVAQVTPTSGHFLEILRGQLHGSQTEAQSPRLL